jgi:hypothetical protein
MTPLDGRTTLLCQQYAVAPGSDRQGQDWESGSVHHPSARSRIWHFEFDWVGARERAIWV